MTHEEIETLVKAMAPVIKEYVEREVEKSEARAAARNEAFLQGLSFANSLRTNPLEPRRGS
jgi:hypothetical protein